MIPQPEPYTPPIPHHQPFWGFSDLALFVGFCAPSLLIAALLVRAASAPFHSSMAVQLLLTQAVWYFLAFGALAVLFRIRYLEPFWHSLGWRSVSITGALGAVLAGPLLTVALGILGVALRAPEIGPPFEQMLGSSARIVLIGVLAVILAPVCEELAFRGFLMPLMIRSLGAAGGILFTGVIFGSIHGYEYQWSWQYMLLISLVGCVFGWAKYKTRSTAVAAIMHSAFNLTQFALYLWRTRTL
jgi:membrane protease YdiL (CAAX protease family)